MKHKKSFAMTDAIVWGAIAVVTILVVLYIEPRLLGKSGVETSELLSTSRNYDGDACTDYFDKCACNPGDERNDCCPEGAQKQGSDALTREKACKEEIKKAYS